MPKPQSDLPQQPLRDPYLFDFLTLHAEAVERELAQWQTEFVKFLPETLKGSLPTIEQLEAEFGPGQGA